MCVDPKAFHTVGVTGSIPVAPTTLFKDLAEKRGGLTQKNYYRCNNGGLGLLKPSDFTPEALRRLPSMLLPYDAEHGRWP